MNDSAEFLQLITEFQGRLYGFVLSLLGDSPAGWWNWHFPVAPSWSSADRHDSSSSRATICGGWQDESRLKCRLRNLANS